MQEAVSRLLELRRGAVDAGITPAGATALVIPQPRVAVGVGQRPHTAQVLHHAAEVRELFGTCLELVVLVTRTTVVDQLISEHSRAAELVQVRGRRIAEGKCHQGFGDPVRMSRAPGHVDDPETGGGSIVLAQQSARIGTLELQTAGVGRIRAAGCDTTKGSTGADRDAPRT